MWPSAARYERTLDHEEGIPMEHVAISPRVVTGRKPIPVRITEYGTDSPLEVSPTATLLDTPFPMQLSDAFEMAGFGWGQYAVVIVAGLAMASMNADYMMLSFVAYCLEDWWGLSSSEASTIVTACVFGRMMGALFWGPFSDAFGRKKAVLASLACVVASGLLMCISPGYIYLVFMVVLNGFGNGAAFVSFDLAVEMLPNDRRGKVMMCTHVMGSGGSIFGILSAWALLSSHWRTLVLVVSLPSLLALPLALFVSESPRWLLQSGRGKEAATELEKIARWNGNDLSNLVLMQPSEDLHTRQQLKEAHWLDLLSPGMILITTLVIFLSFAVGFEHDGVVLFVNRIFESDSSTCSYTYWKVAASALASGVFTLCNSNIIDSFGRRATLFYLAGLGAVTVILTALFQDIDSLQLVLMLATRAGAGALYSVAYVLVPELFPTDLRCTGHALSAMLIQAGGLVVPYIVDDDDISITVVAFVLAVSNFAIGALAASVPVETSGQSLDEVKPVDKAEYQPANLTCPNSPTTPGSGIALRPSKSFSRHTAVDL